MTETKDIHADGSVELCQRWRPGGAQGNEDQIFLDGDEYIFAVRLSTDSWELHSVSASVIPEEGVEFLTVDSGDAWIAWDWSDVEWFIPADEFDLPYLG